MCKTTKCNNFKNTDTCQCSGTKLTREELPHGTTVIGAGDRLNKLKEALRARKQVFNV